jgi:hypothetical protein
MIDPRTLLTPWHDEYKLVSDKTRVVFVGAHVPALEHQCRSETAAPGKRLVMYRPSHNAKPTCYCAKCDLLYVGDEADVAFLAKE